MNEAALFTDEPLPEEDLFTDEPIPEPKTFTGRIKNLGTDIKGQVMGAGKLLKSGVGTSIDMLTDPVAFTGDVLKGAQAVKALPGELINEGKRIGAGELLTGHPIKAAEKFNNAFYEKPLTTAMDVMPFVGAAGKALGIGGKVAKGAELASEAGNIAEKVAPLAEKAAPLVDDISRMAPKAPEALNIGDEASQILKEPIPEVAPPPIKETPGIGEALSGLKDRIPSEIKKPLDEVKEILSNKFDRVAARPGWPETVSSYSKQHGRNMTLKTLGASPGQIRKMGQADADALADMALERGIVSPSVGSIGAQKMIENFSDKSGRVVGGLRKIATQRGAVHDMDQVINQIKANLDPIYSDPLKASEVRSYRQALESIRKTKPTAENVANKVTELFKESKGQDRLKRPSGAISDVARQLRNINDDLIHKKLAPQEIEAYQDALHEYGSMTQMKEFVKRRNSMDAGGRLGPGAGISRMMLQKFLDSVGYRTEARIANKFSDFIKKNPEAASSPKAMLKKYADEAVEAMDEMGDVPQ